MQVLCIIQEIQHKVFWIRDGEDKWIFMDVKFLHFTQSGRQLNRGRLRIKMHKIISRSTTKKNIMQRSTAKKLTYKLK